MKKIAVALGLTLAAGFVSMARGQETPAELPIIGETIDVRVVNVEVVATSESGPVRGLAAGDFRLLVDGKEVPVEFFTEVENGTAANTAASSNTESGPVAPVGPAEAIGRSYLVFIDESFSVSKPRDVVLENLEADLKLMQGEDQMAVLAFNGSTIDVLSPWTSDKAALAAALRQARQRQSQGNALLAKNRSLGHDHDLAVWVGETQEFDGRDMGLILGDMDARVSPARPPRPWPGPCAVSSFPSAARSCSSSPAAGRWAWRRGCMGLW
jgi:hypothetical protein